jgi:hypothetical protein
MTLLFWFKKKKRIDPGDPVTRSKLVIRALDRIRFKNYDFYAKLSACVYYLINN